MTRNRCLFMLSALLVTSTGSATAQLLGGPPPVTIEGNRASVHLGAAGVSVDLTIDFEQVVGLTAANLGISARAVTPVELLGRLPDAALTSLPAGFPLMITIEPPAAGGLSFSGVYTMELHTHDLAFIAGSPLRLFKAQVGGPFADVTQSIGTGSYRVRSTGSGYSQFLIIADLRADSAVVELKFDQLEALLASHAASMPAGVFSALSSQLTAARNSWNAGNVLDAIDGVGTFADAVKTAANAGAIPNVWRSARDIQNVAGALRAGAATLRFSLSLAE